MVWTLTLSQLTCAAAADLRRVLYGHRLCDQPITPRGQIAFGVLLGVLTGLFRLFGGSAEGVSYAIIISNILVPLIEKVTLPKAFGKEGK